MSLKKFLGVKSIKKACVLILNVFKKMDGQNNKKAIKCWFCWMCGNFATFAKYFVSHFFENSSIFVKQQTKR